MVFDKVTVFESGLFVKVRLTEVGHPEWAGGLCPDSLYLQLNRR